MTPVDRIPEWGSDWSFGTVREAPFAILVFLSKFVQISGDGELPRLCLTNITQEGTRGSQSIAGEEVRGPRVNESLGIIAAENH